MRLGLIGLGLIGGSLALAARSLCRTEGGTDAGVGRNTGSGNNTGVEKIAGGGQHIGTGWNTGGGQHAGAQGNANTGGSATLPNATLPNNAALRSAAAPCGNVRIHTIIGIDTNPASRAAAAGVCDAVYASLADVPAGQMPDMLVLATPVRQYPDLARQCRRLLPQTTTISDVGSTKQCLFDAFADAYNGQAPPQLAGSHPIAGSERSGFGAASASLFVHKLVVVVPGEHTDAWHKAQVQHLWQACGARLIELLPAAHDQLLAYTSHLPHLLSYSLVYYLGNQRDNDDIFRFAAGGFRDFTRIASSDPTMWSDVVASNPRPVLAALQGMIGELTNLKQAIEQQDYAGIHNRFSRAKAVRDYFARSQQTLDQQSGQLQLTSAPCSALEGVVQIPGDKSISHRAVMLSAIAEGVSQVSNLLEGEDNLATLQAFGDMGVHIEGPQDGQVCIRGVGLRGLREPPHPLYMGNSGTAMRLMCGLLAGQTFATRLTGDYSLSSRPMHRVIQPLRQMGARICASEDNYAPLRIEPVERLVAIDYAMPMASAQVKSCLLLAGLYADGETCISEPAPTRDHSERMLTTLGVQITRRGQRVCMQPPVTLPARNWNVPGDISSAAFFVVAASIIPNSDILLPRVGINPGRNGVLTILAQMGANISLERQEWMGQEPVADLRVRSARLKGVAIGAQLIALAIDEFPILCIAAACATGTTSFSGAQELRVKESDRIAAMVQGLQALGVDALAKEDGASICGGPIQGGRVDSLGDHRIAMAFAVAGGVAAGPISIANCANIATSFPGFVPQAGALGMHLTTSEASREI